MHAQALAGPQGSAEASLQYAQPYPAAMQAHHGALPELGQSALEDEALPPGCPPAYAGCLYWCGIGGRCGG